MNLYVHVYEQMPDEHGYLSFVLQAKFASVLDALDYYELKKKRNPNTLLMLIDTYHNMQVDTFC